MENNWWNVRVFIKSKSYSHFSEEISQSENSKSSRLSRLGFENHLSYVVWGSPFKFHTAFCGKIVSSSLKDSMQIIVNVM